MGIINDMKQQDAVAKLFDLTKFGVGVVGGVRGYPAATDLDENGRWSEGIAVDRARLERVNVFENDPGSRSLVATLVVTDPGHPAQNDTCRISIRLDGEALDNPEGGWQTERAGKAFRMVRDLLVKAGKLEADFDADTYTEALPTFSQAWQTMNGVEIRGGMRFSVYTNRDGEVKGPYADLKWADVVETPF